MRLVYNSDRRAQARRNVGVQIQVGDERDG